MSSVTSARRGGGPGHSAQPWQAMTCGWDRSAGLHSRLTSVPSERSMRGSSSSPRSTCQQGRRGGVWVGVQVAANPVGMRARGATGLPSLRTGKQER